MNYSILILIFFTAYPLMANNNNKTNQILQVVCQGEHLGAFEDTVVILTQEVPDDIAIQELIDYKKFESTDIEVPFKLQMLAGKINLTETQTIADSAKSLLKNTKPENIKEADVVASRFYRLLKFKSNKEESHYFDIDLKGTRNKYKGSFLKFGMTFQCSEPFYVDFKKTKPGMNDMSGNVPVDTFQDGDACTIGKDPECVEVDAKATN